MMVIIYIGFPMTMTMTPLIIVCRWRQAVTSLWGVRTSPNRHFIQVVTDAYPCSAPSPCKDISLQLHSTLGVKCLGAKSFKDMMLIDCRKNWVWGAHKFFKLEYLFADKQKIFPIKQYIFYIYYLLWKQARKALYKEGLANLGLSKNLEISF